MRVEPELPDHPKFLRLKKMVGEGAMEYVIRLFGHCQGNQRGEHWPGADADYVEMICRWDGQPGVLFKAFTDCGRPGFIELCDDGVRVHDWNEMNSQTVANWNKNRNGRAGKKATVNPPLKPVVPLGQDGGSIPKTEEPNRNPVLTPLGNQSKSNEEAMTLSLSPSFIPPSGKPPESNGNPVLTPRGAPVVEDDYALAGRCVALLNSLTGSQFNLPLQEQDGIIARLIEVNRDVVGIEKMLRRQVALWKNDPKARHWLKPGTLFGSNFHDYYGQRDLPTAAGIKTARARGEILQELAAAREQKAPAEQIRALQRELEVAA